MTEDMERRAFAAGRKMPHHRFPLTSSELADIRSLLGAASATTTTTTATATVRSSSSSSGAQHSSRDDNVTTPARAPRPLAGRRVMVPALFASSTTLKSSSKSAPRAFFEGVLQPKVAENSTNNNTDAASAMNEVIRVHVGNNNYGGDESALVEMTRTEALQYFEDGKQRAENRVSSSIPSESTKPPSTTTTSSTTKSRKGTPNTRFHKDEDKIQFPDDINHPLIEIREICNSKGQIQHSEVVNMSNVIKRLGERLQDVASLDNEGEKKTAKEIGSSCKGGGGGDSFDDERRLGNILAQTLVGVGKDEIVDGISTLAGGEDFDSYCGTFNEQVSIHDTTYPETTKKVIDETKYRELRARLDELERLEEEENEEEKRRAKKNSSMKIKSGGSSGDSQNRTASTRLGSGWSRGFLNSSGATTKTTKQTKTKAGDPSNSTCQYAMTEEEEGNSTRVTFSNDERIRSEINPPIGSMPSSSTSARVKFSSRDDTITTTENKISGGGSVDGQSSSTMMSLPPNSAKVSFTVSDDTISPASSSRMLLDAVPSAPSLLSRSSNSSARVTFSDDDVITEIPRIGQSRVPPRPVSASRPVYFNNQPTIKSSLSVEDDPPLFSSSIPFKENIFGGIVKERTSIEDTSGDRTESAPSWDRSDGGKKLSRFAQQRLQKG